MRRCLIYLIASFSAMPLYGQTLPVPAVSVGAGNNYFVAGTGDGGTLSTYNSFLRLHWGIAIGSPFASNGSGGHVEKATIAFDGRSGNITTLGNIGIGQLSPASYALDISTAGDFQGIQMSHSSGKWSRFFSSLPGGAFNGITAPNDAGIVFGQDGTLSHGFVIAPHRYLTSGIRIDRDGNVGMGASNPEGLQVNLALATENSRGVTNVRMGVLAGTPRIILDQAGSQSFEIDNAGGRFRIFNPGVERFTIANDGNVGIGTENPQQKLHVNGTVYSTKVRVDVAAGSGPDASYPLDISTAGDFQGIQMSHSSGKWLRFFSSLPGGAFNGITTPNDAGIIFGQDGTLSHGFIIAPHRYLTSGIRIDSDGNVGMGASHPEGLQVNLGLHTENSRGVTNVRMGVLAGTPRIILDQAGSQSFEIDNAGGRFRIFNPGVERFTIANDGNVGIGTTNPQHRLHVKGTIYSTEVKVDVAAGSGPDYVFLDNYPLPSLEEVKTHINAHKHLPEVPSAKEMEANGIQLGEMNLLLLKKIEELTIYIINQEERIKQLEAKQLKK
jgi:hypothetical protein